MDLRLNNRNGTAMEGMDSKISMRDGSSRRHEDVCLGRFEVVIKWKGGQVV